MSFRSEYKFRLTISNYLLFKINLFNKGMKRLYPKRAISSIYFDNKNLQSFRDSEDGIMPRKKFRIRNYSLDLKKNSLFEIKISSAEGRFKKSNLIEEQIRKKYLKDGYFDNYYGHCLPCIKIEYQREYFLLNNLRVTFDENIKYKKYLNNNSIADNENVVEVKSNEKIKFDFIENIFGCRQSRFSKYSRGIIALNK